MKRFLHTLWDSILGKENDYTKINLRKALLLLAVPMILEMLLEALFAILDIFYVSKLGNEAVTVIGLTESLMTIIYAIGVGMALATTGFVARRIGEKNDVEAANGAIQAIILGIIVSLCFAVPGIFMGKKILTLMHAEQKVIDMGWKYTSLMFGGNFLIMLLFINNAIFRSAGAPALSLRVLLLANLLNMVLDPCFIFGLGPFPELGVTGAAVATNIGRGIGVIYQFYMLFTNRCRIRLRLSQFKIHAKTMWKILYLSGGGIFQYLIATASWIVLYLILARYGSDVVSGYTIAVRLFLFFLLPAWGLSNAASTLVGQNLGAKSAARAERSVWIAALATSIYMLLVMFAFLLFPEFLIGIFSIQGKAFQVGVVCLKIIGIGMVFYGFEMIIAQAFNGAGDTYTPTILNIIAFWLLQVPLAMLLSGKFEMEENGVFYAILISEAILAVLGSIIFLRGKWKTRVV